ncbi:hypothetical protein CHL78_004645 [Romboutsia weinsteinii]|uniref:Cell division protein FtsL n=1 Tax=Romboutsia weinsteinii TaxID=2020949 RepID=A0A371J6U6_9FIRM|nr:hypothetical protein [Romboutsia weinsteinii]RDY28479.1 hypothetical protein CHL78_004645 [Romboutsia weinsteinii]
MEANNKIRELNEYKKINKNNYRNRGKKKTKKIIPKIFIAICILGIVIGNLYGYSAVSQLKYDIYYLEKELRQKEVALEEVKATLSNNTSVQEIEKKAKDELNMEYPKDDQIEYIDVDN